MTIFSIEEFRTLRSIAKMEQRGDVISNRRQLGTDDQPAGFGVSCVLREMHSLKSAK